LKKALLRRTVAEAIGTCAIVFLGCGALMVMERFPGSVPAGSISIIFGLTVAAMIYTFGHISGAHFNPAVTLAFAIGRHFPARDVLAYWFAQFSGAAIGSSLLSLLLPDGSHYGETQIHLPIAQAFAWEMIITFFLMIVVMAVATDTRAVGTMAGAAIGIAVMVLAFVAGPLTGASMNPARSFGPAIFAGRLADMWLYLTAPILGAALAALSYNWLKYQPD
jgi:aquaporin NIP